MQLRTWIIAAWLVGLWATPAQLQERAISIVPLGTESPDLAPAQQASRGVFIGVDEFDHSGINDLKFCAADAQAMRDVFVKELQLLPAENTQLLISGPAGDASPTRQNMLKAINETCRKAGAEGLVVIFVSTHGLEDGLVAQDTDLMLLDETTVELDYLSGKLASSPAPRRLVMIDACREKPVEAGTRSVVSPTMSKTFAEALAQCQGTVTLKSCAQGQVSYEMSATGHGAFTHFLLTGLRGEAPADNVGLIRATQLCKWVRDRVEQWSQSEQGTKQSPLLYMQDVSEDFPLAYSRASLEADQTRRAQLKELIDKLKNLLGSGEEALSGAEFDKGLELLTAGPEGNRAAYDLTVALAQGHLAAPVWRVSIGNLLVPSPVPTPTMPTGLIVAQDGTGQFGTIQEGLDAAQSGETVVVRPGSYRESLRFKSGVHLVGTDRQACRVEPVEGAVAVLTAIDCQEGSIENLTFTSQGLGWNEIPSLGVSLESGTLNPKVLEILKNSAAGAAGMRKGDTILAVDGRDVSSAYCVTSMMAAGMPDKPVKVKVKRAGKEVSYSITPRKMQFDDGSWPAGILLIDSSVRVANCECRNLGSSGMNILGRDSAPVLQSNICRQNKFNGIYLEGGTGAVVEGNTCEENPWSGIAICGPGTSATVRNNQSNRNVKHGIAVELGASGLMEGNTCEANQDTGIAVFNEDTTPEVKGNTCNRNTRNGIYFGSGAGGQAEGNTCDENLDTGIVVRGADTTITLRANTCRRNVMHGIYFGEGAQGLVESNVCEANLDTGITLRDAGTSPTVSGNQSRRNSKHGIFVGEGTTSTVEGNTCENNEDSGVTVRGAGAAPLVKGNQCLANTRHGICFWEGAEGTARGNTCDRNQDTGIAVFSADTAPQLEENLCRGNKQHGIYFGDGAEGSADNNTCTGNEAYGIYAAGAGTRVKVSNNTCSDNTSGDLQFSEGAVQL